MKMMNLFKTLRLMIGLQALLVSMPINAYDFECDGIYYDVKENHELSVVSGDTEYKGDIVLPSEVPIYSTMYKVTAIRDAFYRCSELTSVTIPGSITYISEGSFSYCNNLTSLMVESSNQHYDSRDDCNAIIKTSTNVLVAGCRNTAIPNSVTSIADGAFTGCSGLTSIAISSSVTTIGFSAFRSCTGLTSVTIPSRIVRDYAFSGCTNLTSVTILEGVSRIDTQVFKDCTSLTSVTISDGVTELGGQIFQGCTSLTSVSIPNSVTRLGYSAFAYCTGLTSVTISNNVTVLEEGTFKGCTSLKTIDIPSSVTHIGTAAFYGCTSLKTIDIPSSVTHIGTAAFYGCSGLTTIVSEIEKPFELESRAFDEDTYLAVELIVPKGTKAKYQATGGWNQFAKITEVGTTDLKSITTTAPPAAVYTLQGQRVESVPRKGIFIQNGKKVVIKIN